MSDTNWTQDYNVSFKTDDPLLEGQVVLLMDHARIHHHSLVLERARKDGVMVLFSSDQSTLLG